MAEGMRLKIVRLGKAGLSMPEIAAQCLVSWQVVRTILHHDVPMPLVPEDAPDPAPEATPPMPATEQPSKGSQKAPERRLEQASTSPGETVRKARTKVSLTPPKVVASPTTKRDQPHPVEPQPRQASRPVADRESRILSETPPKQPERVSSVSEAEREKRDELVREAVAAGRVTKLPPGSAAGLSDIETRFHAAPLAVEQMKGAVGKRARMLAAGRNGRRRRLLK